METVRVCTAAASYMRFHALAALVLGNLCFPSFFQRAHSDFQIREFRFNHVTRCVATELYGGMRERCKVACETRYSIVTKEGWFCVARFLVRTRREPALNSLQCLISVHTANWRVKSSPCPIYQLRARNLCLVRMRSKILGC